MNTHKLLLKISFIIVLFCNSIIIKAQSVAINTDGTTAATSALLDVKSTTQGILIPRMTAAQRTAIATPATGLMVYQTDATAGFYFYNGTAWTSLNGTNGTNGTNGQGVPTGGTANQVLAKVNGTDYNTAWVTPAGADGVQLYATSTVGLTKNINAFNRYAFNFNNTVSGANTVAFTNGNTYTVPAGMGGLYEINTAMIITAFTGYQVISPAPEIQVTSGASIRYYYGVSDFSNLFEGNSSEGTTFGTRGAPFSMGRGAINSVIPLLAGDVVKVFFRGNSSGGGSSQSASFSSDGSCYLSIIKLN